MDTLAGDRLASAPPLTFSGFCRYEEDLTTMARLGNGMTSPRIVVIGAG